MTAATEHAAQAVAFDTPRVIAPEDQVRADFYALLASLFAGAPDGRLLQAIVIAAEPASASDGALTKTWRALAEASAVVTHDALTEEYESVFVGVGRPPVMLYGSYYLAGFMMEKPLAELRTDLASRGFARAADVREPEDHLAALCDVMRALILGDLATMPASIAEQKSFFARHMQPWVGKCCAAVVAYEKANYYRRVAQFASAFFDIETEAFDLQ
jgi:TorA maturation chaperone TorD